MWPSIRPIIRSHVNDYKSKFNRFCLIVRCQINQYLKTKQDEWYWKYVDRETESEVYDCVSKNINKRSNLKIQKIIITIRADYDKMTPRHYLQQPRRVLESQMIKHISKVTNREKFRKHNYLASKYQL